MKTSLIFAILILSAASPALVGYQSANDVYKMEAAGDSAGARAALARAAQANPDDPAVLTAYAEFLERYDDPGAREAYSRLLAAVRKSGNTTRAAAIARRLAILDLMAGERTAASGNLATAGQKLTVPQPAA